jgi:translation initiation factor IF-2
MGRGQLCEIGMARTRLIHGARGRLGLEGAMPGMKITVDAAMRVRDVSQPRPDHEAAALAADALAAPARLGGSGPALARPGSARPDPTRGPDPARGTARPDAARGTARPGPARGTARPGPARGPGHLDTAVPDAAQAGGSHPSGGGGPASPAPGSPAPAVPGSTSPGSTPSSPAAAAPAATERAGRERRGTGGKRHRSRRRFNR